jgi:hypothetical protein
MHTQMLRAALAAFAVLLPVRSEAQASAPPERTGAQSPQAVVGQLLSHRQELLAELLVGRRVPSERIDTHPPGLPFSAC